MYDCTSDEDAAGIEQRRLANRSHAAEVFEEEPGKLAEAMTQKFFEDCTNFYYLRTESIGQSLYSAPKSGLDRLLGCN